MISHFNIGIKDLSKAEAFYNELLAIFNASQMFKTERSIFYSMGEGSSNLVINTPFNGEPASSGNGAMVAFTASETAQVDKLHAKALELGGSCEGAPGIREGYGIYAAYFRDPDGNKFGVFCQPKG